MPNELLNENQRRSVTITLRLFEERLAEIERLLTVDERGCLYTRIADLEPAQIRMIQGQITHARTLICQLTAEFGLEVEPQDPARRIFGLLAVTWESLEELRGTRLAAYGHLNSDLPAALDPSVEKLTQLVRSLQSVLAPSSLEAPDR